MRRHSLILLHARDAQSAAAFSFGKITSLVGRLQPRLSVAHTDLSHGQADACTDVVLRAFPFNLQGIERFDDLLTDKMRAFLRTVIKNNRNLIASQSPYGVR